MGAVRGVREPGEVCSAGSRILVEKKIYSKFVDAMAAKAKTIKLGAPMKRDTKMGPLVSKEQFERVRAYQEIGKKEAKVAVGGNRVAKESVGYFVEPTIFTTSITRRGSRAKRYLVPVATVISFNDEADAIRIANDTKFGLAAAVWSRDIFKAFRVVKALRAGIVWVNHMQPTYVEAPWAATNSRDSGRELGPNGIDEYLETSRCTSI